ncbi:MAG: HAMP domain-containing histidine kinase [Plectolyngbya sp. WJT66-NPBG17]|jgi:signal transduction histidine kinase|nr:HAMP domain-containing histidine kinase [Plectolyngbya sp. WJT66-NPBG17]MBW4524021.1 HAMP domain-containing histidine kinase [Phormidium tanganyikae FI6-MK23]
MKSTHQATRVFTPVLEESRRPAAQFEQPDHSEFTWIESGWFSTIAQQSPDLVGAVSLEGNWLCLNSSGKAMLGFMDALSPFTAILSEAMQHLWHETVLPQLAECGHWRGQFVMLRQSEPISFESQWFLIRDQYTNQPLGFATISRECSEAIAVPAPAALEQALEKEKDYHQQKTSFLADAAHELKTPLAVISTSIDLLNSDRLSIDRKQKHVQRLRAKIRQMTQVLDDILILSRSEQPEFALHLTEIDPIQFCEELVEEAQMNSDRHEIVFSAESSVPTILMDTGLFQRILANLLSNSIKYSPNGGKIFCRLSIEDHQFMLQVQDSGIGIPALEQSQLFRSFYRASNAGRIGGTGLGLAIVKKCVDRLGGQIAVSSTVQVETCFTITIPIDSNLE